MKYIGVDGCKTGWFYTAIDHENDWEIGVSENIEKLWETHKDAHNMGRSSRKCLTFKKKWVRL